VSLLEHTVAQQWEQAIVASTVTLGTIVAFDNIADFLIH
jgi:hypothetical protein